MKLIYRKDLQIEDVRTDEYWNRLRIYSLLNRDTKETRLKNHHIVYSCLNDKSTVLNILKSNKVEKDVDLLSVYELNNRTYILDNLPIFTYLKIANSFPKSFVKMKDLRYLDRETTYFVRIPKEVCDNLDIRKEYEGIQLKSIRNYREIYKKKGIYPKEMAQQVLPLGIQHRSSISLSSKETLNLTNDLICSDLVVDNQLGDMFEKLLEKEFKILPDCNQRKVYREVLEYLRDIISQEQSFRISMSELSESFKYIYVKDIVENIFSNFEMLINPLGSKDELEFDYEDQVAIGGIIKKNNLGNIAKSKGSLLTGFMSISNMTKLIDNHMDMFIPLLSDLIDMEKELDRKNNECFVLPQSLKTDSELEKDIHKKLIDAYSDIKDWRAKSLDYMSAEMSNEFTKYLLPLSHMTRFNLYLDVNDIFSIKSLDFDYKDQWLKLFFQKDPMFKK